MEEEADAPKGIRWFVRETIFAVIIVALLAAFGFWKALLILMGLGLLISATLVGRRAFHRR